MADSALEFYADLYHSLGERMSPVEVDRLELWQAFAVLGHHRPESYWEALRELAWAEVEARRPPEPEPDPGVEPTPRVRSRRGRARSRISKDEQTKATFDARRAHARGEAPKPEPGGPTGNVGEVMARLRQG